MKNLKLHFKIWANIILSGIIILTLPSSTFALTEAQWSMFNANGIYYWNPQGFSNGCISGTNSTYSGANIFSNSEINAITANQPFYEAAAAKYGFEWQILAAIHSMEYSSQRSNPSNGQGAYQLYSYTNGGKNSNAFLPAGAISDEEFTRQSEIAASVIKGKADSAGLNLSNGDDIKHLFFLYNGNSSHYIQKALDMGFSQEQANNGEGSPYVMNRYDDQRDPTNPNVSPYWKGKYTSDGNYDPNASMGTRFGAYVKYLTLGGGGTSSSSYCVGNGNLVAGGMTLAQAKDFMAEYRNITPSEWGTGGELGPYNISATTCSGGDLANCVAFVKYFVNRYTIFSDTSRFPSGIGATGNGGDVVTTLLSRNEGFVNGSTIPRPYAIFSVRKGSTMCGAVICGHTGVVLGIDTDKNQIIIGEAGCGQPLSWADAHVYQLSDYMNGSYTYAYTDGILKM